MFTKPVMHDQLEESVVSKHAISIFPTQKVKATAFYTQLALQMRVKSQLF